MAKRQRRGCGTIVFAIVWIVFSLFAMGVTGYIYLNEARENKVLDEHGTIINATVTDKEEEYDEGTTYWVWYSFQVKAPNGETKAYAGRESVSSATYYRLEKGGPVEVIYASTDPTISDIQGERNTSPWFLPVFAGVFVIFGLTMLVWTIRRDRASDSNSSIGTISDPSSSMLRPAYATYSASIDLDALRCEQTGLLLGPELADYVRQTPGMSDYTLTEGKIKGSGCLGSFFLVFGLVFSGMPTGFTLFGNIRDGFETFDLIGVIFTLPFVVAGLAIVALGIYLIFGKHTTLHNEKTGQHWQMSVFLGRQIYEIRASGLQDVNLAGSSFKADYPVSCATLVNGDSTTGIIYNTILSLMERKALTMRQQYTSTRLFFKRTPIYKWRFAFIAADKGNLPQGRLERKLTEAPSEPGLDVAVIPQQFSFLVGTMSVMHGCSINELLRHVANNTEHNNPDRWFITELVGPDAQDLGLGTVTKVRLRREYENAPGIEASVAAINQHMDQVRADFQRRYPEAAEDLWQAIEAGLKAMEPSD